jgi:hypothetical protein
MHGELALMALGSFEPSPAHQSPHHFPFVIFMETTTISSNGESEVKDEIQGLIASFPSERNWDGSPLNLFL